MSSKTPALTATPSNQSLESTTLAEIINQHDMAISNLRVATLYETARNAHEIKEHGLYLIRIDGQYLQRSNFRVNDESTQTAWVLCTLKPGREDEHVHIRAPQQPLIEQSTTTGHSWAYKHFTGDLGRDGDLVANTVDVLPPEDLWQPHIDDLLAIYRVQEDNETLEVVKTS